MTPALQASNAYATPHQTLKRKRDEGTRELRAGQISLEAENKKLAEANQNLKNRVKRLKIEKKKLESSITDSDKKIDDELISLKNDYIALKIVAAVGLFTLSGIAGVVLAPTICPIVAPVISYFNSSLLASSSFTYILGGTTVVITRKPL